jgi:hypothetical protein
MKHALQIMEEMKGIDFLDCNQEFVYQAQQLIQSKYNPSVNTTADRIESPTNIHSNFMITKETCIEAVTLFLSVLMPQHFIIMNPRMSTDNKETLPELQLETKILKVNYHIFHKTILFGNIGALKNIDKDIVDHLLNRLVKRNILKKGIFLQFDNRNKYESYMKYLPRDQFEEQQLIFELNKHKLSWEEYRETYRMSDVSPAGTVVTPYGKIELQKQNIDFMRTNTIQQQRVVRQTTNSLTNLGQTDNSKF